MTKITVRLRSVLIKQTEAKHAMAAITGCTWNSRAVRAAPPRYARAIRVPDPIAHTDAERGENNHHSLFNPTRIQPQTPHITTRRYRNNAVRKKKKKKKRTAMNWEDSTEVPGSRLCNFPVYIYIFIWLVFLSQKTKGLFFFLFFSNFGETHRQTERVTTLDEIPSLRSPRFSPLFPKLWAIEWFISRDRVRYIYSGDRLEFALCRRRYLQKLKVEF